MITENEQNKPISLKNQWMYAINEVGSNPIYTLTLSFLTFFYTDTLGIDAGIVGTIILISKIFDGITDIAAGNIIDHTHTAKGSARPWILRSAILLAISYVILFTVPNCAMAGKIVYIFVSYNFAMSVAFTILNAAINAIPMYMSNDSKSRTSAYSLRMIVSGLVSAVFSMICLKLVNALGGDQVAWIKMACIMGVVSLVALLITYFGTEEHVVPAKESDNIPLLEAVKVILHNKYWLMVLGMIVIIVLHQVTTLTVGVYYAKYILFDETLAGNLVLYHHAGGAVGLLSMPFLIKKGIPNKKLAMGGAIFMLVGSLVAIVNCRGIFLIISLALRGCGFGVVNSMYYGMLADTVDYGEYKTGLRPVAVASSGGTVGQKLGSGIGTAAMGFALSACGYDGLLAAQPAAANSCINIIFNVVPLVLYVLLIIMLCFYKLDKDLPQIQEELAAGR